MPDWPHDHPWPPTQPSTPTAPIVVQAPPQQPQVVVVRQPEPWHPDYNPNWAWQQNHAVAMDATVQALNMQVMQLRSKIQTILQIATAQPPAVPLASEDAATAAMAAANQNAQLRAMLTQIVSLATGVM